MAASQRSPTVGIIDLDEYKNADPVMKAEFVNRLKKMVEVWTFSRTTLDSEEAHAIREELRLQGVRDIVDRTFIADRFNPQVLSRQIALADAKGPHDYFYFGVDIDKANKGNVLPANVVRLPLIITVQEEQTSARRPVKVDDVASALAFVEAEQEPVSVGLEGQRKVTLDDVVAALTILRAEEESLSEKLVMDSSLKTVTRLNNVTDAIERIEKSYGHQQLTYPALEAEFDKLGINRQAAIKEQEESQADESQHLETVGREMPASTEFYLEAVKILLSEIKRLAKDYKINIGDTKKDDSIIKYAQEIAQGKRVIPMDKTTETFALAAQRERDLLSALNKLVTQKNKGKLTEKVLIQQLMAAESKMAPTHKHRTTFSRTFGRLYTPSKTSSGQEKIKKVRLAMEKKISKQMAPVAPAKKGKKA